MPNDDVYCHACLSILADLACGSLNLAQAVQVIAYEWRQALGGFVVAPATRRTSAPTWSAMQAALAHWGARARRDRISRPGRAEEADAAAEPVAQPRRAEASDEEVDILRGIARSIETLPRRK